MQWGGRGAQVAEFYFERNERLPQYCTEAVLRDRLKDAAISQTPDSVRWRARVEETGRMGCA